MGSVRGGSCNNNDRDNLRLAYRNNNHPAYQNKNVGFRVGAPQHSFWSHELYARVVPLMGGHERV